ncbi:RNA methyltransferase [Niastella caeni]|uniref:RNA methyltransferase n=1 Tax=Niastella caeni TaxID=2569763 RepID=A0A4S8HWP1_9BACT|nr:RNA methyltransferase [Niastella caeni]THU39885.1 RNA methyltransferase [Niastella caeni]
MQLPQQLLDSLTGIAGFDKEAFVQVHESGEQVVSVRVNPFKSEIGNRQSAIDGSDLTIGHFNLPQLSKIPWCSYGYYLPERPAFIFDPLIHAGAYYVQEASSMFVEQALTQTMDVSQPLRVLDLCAAPGGKSTLLQSLISADSLLVSNEVIKSRAAILEENCVKWGGANVIVTNADPITFARLENFFDVIVVDAPCSGSGLFRREREAIGEWSEQNVQLCYQRQQRILADVFPALKEGGVLIYSTCSYSKEEDEGIGDWLMDTFTVDSLPLKIDTAWGIVETQSDKHQAYGYRFFPNKIKGEGFFISSFRKQEGGASSVKPPKKSLLQKASKNEAGIIQPWLQPKQPVQLWKQKDELFAFPVSLEKELLTIVDNVYVRRAGTAVGKIAGNDLVPDHALAVSTLINQSIVAVSLKKEDAIQYLRKEEVSVSTSHKGWTLVQFEQYNLGWIKVLQNRINNYYPQGWRILKRTTDSANEHN